MVSAAAGLGVSQAFRAFAFGLEVTADEERHVALRQREIEMVLRPLFAIEHTFVGGSFARRTAVKPVRAADLFVELGPAERTYLMRRPSALIRAFGNALAPCLGGLEEGPGHLAIDFARGRRQPVSRINLRPTFAHHDGWSIPDAYTNSWRMTDLGQHAQLAEDCANRMPGRWRSLVQMMKCWNMAQSPMPIQPAFLIEVTALECLKPPLGAFDHEVYGFFELLGQRLSAPWLDPAGSGALVRETLTGDELGRAQAAVRMGQARARSAITSAGLGDTRGALESWRTLFGSQFPLD